jgi:hypothetical protein
MVDVEDQVDLKRSLAKAYHKQCTVNEGLYIHLRSFLCIYDMQSAFVCEGSGRSHNHIRHVILMLCFVTNITSRFDGGNYLQPNDGSFPADWHAAAVFAQIYLVCLVYPGEIFAPCALRYPEYCIKCPCLLSTFNNCTETACICLN